MVLNRETVDLINRLKEFSPSTFEHSVNVALLSADFGEYIGLSEEDIDKLKTAGFLHDIGKLSIPEDILHKNGPLSKEEYDLIKEHPELGIKLLRGTFFNNEEILSYVLSHHERPDGLGYPSGLKGKEIPDLAKIITVCDCYDAMKSRRAYKDIYTKEYIKNELINNAGTQFDYYYLNLFLSYLDANRIISL